MDGWLLEARSGEEAAGKGSKSWGNEEIWTTAGSTSDLQCSGSSSHPCFDTRFSLSQKKIRVKKRWKIETGSMLSFVQVTAEKIIVKAKEEALMITAKANEEAQNSIADATMETERVSGFSV